MATRGYSSVHAIAFGKTFFGKKYILPNTMRPYCRQSPHHIAYYKLSSGPFLCLALVFYQAEFLWIGISWDYYFKNTDTPNISAFSIRLRVVQNRQWFGLVWFVFSVTRHLGARDQSRSFCGQQSIMIIENKIAFQLWRWQLSFTLPWKI